MARLYTTKPKFSEVPSYIRQEVPVYRLREDIYTEDTLFLKGTTVEADEDSVPNEAMFPVNDLAVKQFRAFLKGLDEKAAEWSKIPLKERSGYMQVQPKLPAFDAEWEKVNALAKSRNIHIVHAVDQSPSILGAPRAGKPKIRAVDTNMIPQVPYENQMVTVKGNETRRNSVEAVQSAVAG